MTHVRSMTAATCLAGLVMVASAGGWLRDAAAVQGAIVDEGAFRISRGGGAATEVESFRISRGDNGQLVATSQLNAGTRRLVTNLVADSIGTPITYYADGRGQPREDRQRSRLPPSRGGWRPG